MSVNKIRQTVLDINLSSAAKKRMDEVLQKAQAIEEALKASEQAFNKLAKGKFTSPSARNKYIEEQSGGAKTDLTQSRKIIEQNRSNLKTLLGVASREMSQGLPQAQKALISSAFNTILSELNGTFKDTAKKVRQKTSDFIDNEFKRKVGSQRVDVRSNANPKPLSGKNLEQSIQSLSLTVKGAQKALNTGLTKKDESLIKSATTTLEKNQGVLNRFQNELRDRKLYERQLKSSGVKSAELENFNQKAFKRNPSVTRQEEIKDKKIKTLTLQGLQEQQASRRTLLAGAQSANKFADKNNNRDLYDKSALAIKQHQTALEKLSAETKLRTSIEKTNNQARIKQRSVEAFYDKRYGDKPEVKRKEAIAEAKIRDLKNKELQDGLQNANLRKGASYEALNFARKNGDSRLETDARKAITDNTAQLKALTDENKRRTQTTAQNNRAKVKSGNFDEFVNRQFKLNPAVQRFDPIKQSKLGGLTDSQLKDQIASQKLLVAGANKANSFAIDNKRSEAEQKRASAALADFTRALKAAQQEMSDRSTTRNKKAPITDAQRRSNAVESDKQRTMNRSFDGGAGLFKQQAALLRNYAVMGAGVGAVTSAATFSNDLDKQFKQLQSIVALTNTEMNELKTNLIDVSEETKFTALEVADAAVILGQAGFGSKEIQDSIQGVTLFATAVGSDLKSAVDLATSTLGVFKKDASEMTDITDKMTTAVNSSKLNLDKLSLGLQYSGNLAAQSNVRFEEVVAALGAMANAGIRSGSTLGTGLRQIIIALRKPSEQFVSIVRGLGIGMDDLDISTRGLIPVLKTLANAGFTSRDAIESMQVRAASAFQAFVGNIKVADELQTKMELGGSAARANGVQMGALANQLARLGSVANSIAFEAFEPMLKVFAKLVEVTTDALTGIRNMGPALQGLGTAVITFLGIKGIASVIRLLGFLVGGGGALRAAAGFFKGAGAVAAGGTAAAATGGAAVASTTAISSIMAVVFRILGLASPIGWAATALSVAGGVAAYSSSKRGPQENNLDISTAGYNKAEAEVESYNKRVDKLSSSISELIFKQDRLSDPKELRQTIQNLNSDFKQQGLFISKNVKSYDELIAKMLEFEEQTKDARFFLEGESRSKLQKNIKDMKEDILSNPELRDSTSRILNSTSNENLGFNDIRQMPRVERFLTKESLKKGSSFEGFNAKRDEALTLVRDFESGSDTSLDGLRNALEIVKEMQAQFVSFKENKVSDYEGTLTKYFGLNKESRAFGIKQIDDLEKGLSEFAQKVNALTIAESSFQDNSEENRTKRDQVTALVTEAGRAIASEGNAFRVGSKKINDRLVTPKGEKSTLTGTDYIQAYEDTKKLYEQEVINLEQNRELIKGVLLASGIDETQIEPTLNKEGYYEEYGTSISNAKRTVKSAAQLAAGPFAQQTADKRSSIQATIEELMPLFSNEQNLERSEALEAQLNKLFASLETLTTNEVKFNKDLNGGDDATIRQREITELQVNESRRAKLAESQDRTFNLIEVSKSLRAGEGIPDGETKLTDRDLKKLLGDFITEANSKIDQQETIGQRGVESIGRDIDETKYQFDQSTEIAKAGSGYEYETRVAAFEKAQELQQTIAQLTEEQLAAERQILLDKIDSLNALKAQADKILADENVVDGEAKNKLRKDSQKAAQDVSGLNLELEKLETEAKDSRRGVGELKDSLKLLEQQLVESNFNSTREQQIGARLYGKAYNPTDNATEDTTNLSRSGRNIAEVAEAGGKSVLGDLQAYYTGFDPLVDSVMQLTELGKGLGDTFADTFVSIVTGAESGSRALKNLLAGFLTEVLQIAANAAFKKAIQMLVDIGLSLLGGGGDFVGDGASTMNFGSNMTAYTGGEMIAGSYYKGGEITSGSTSRDSTYAKVAKGEFVLRRRAVQALGLDTVKALNSADPSSIQSSEAKLAHAGMDTKVSEGKDKTVNVWVVTPDQKPDGLSENDIVTVVSDNINRNGTIKKLVRSISMNRI